MSNRLPVLRALALVLVAFATSASAGETDVSPSPAAGTVSAEHERLAALAGVWDVKQSLRLKPGEPPQRDTGTARFTVELGGRALRQDLHIDSRPPFQGIGVTGYDTLTRTWFTGWMDLNFTDLLVLRGVRDERANTWRFAGSMREATGATVPTREELTLVDHDHLVARYFETRQGTETLVVQLEYSRR